MPETSDAAGSDPCPPTAPNLNCSTTCGGPTTSCAETKCGATAVVFVKTAMLPFTIRTPDRPGVDPKCPKSCSFATVAKITYGMLATVSAGTTNIRVTTRAPWFIYQPGPSPDDFCPTASRGTCFRTNGFMDLLIATTDPNAPSQNIVIEQAPAGFTCP